jgi:hypothetical protein
MKGTLTVEPGSMVCRYCETVFIKTKTGAMPWHTRPMKAKP